MTKENHKHCSSCNVQIHAQHTSCPLCGRKLVGIASESLTAYPIYTYPKGKRGFTVRNVLLFSTIVACILSLYINLFTLDSVMEFWSGAVTCALLSQLMLAHTIYSDSISVGKKMLISYAILSILVFTIDLCSGFYKWSSTFVIPFMTVALTITYTSLALSGKRRYRDYLGYLIANFFISFIPLLLFLFGFSTQFWTSALALLYSLITCVGLFIFSDERFKSELKKRFHF